MRISAIYLAISMTLLCGCMGSGPDDEFIDTPSQYELIVKGKSVFKYNPATCQTSYNTLRHEYRVHTDNMSDWYSLKLDSEPRANGQKLKGSISWTETNSIAKKSGLNFSISKTTSDGRVWLWCRKEQIGAIIQTDN